MPDTDPIGLASPGPASQSDDGPEYVLRLRPGVPFAMTYPEATIDR